MVKGGPKHPSISDGIADREFCIGTTPGLNIHAQAEPSWLPVWTLDGNDAAWVAKGTDHDGEWELRCEPDDSEHIGPTLSVFQHSISCSLITLTPDQARALRHTLGEWLLAVDSCDAEKSGVRQ